jgi:hypothetical protein
MGSAAEYSDHMLQLSADEVAESHVLVIQWDGMPHSPAHWDDAFLQYDYIGAPWPGVPTSFAVGNGGLSLRSRRLLAALAKLDIRVDSDADGDQSEDVLICQTNRARLEALGIRFAPIEVAQRFAFESGVATPNVFGFHSSYNFPWYFHE